MKEVPQSKAGDMVDIAIGHVVSIRKHRRQRRFVKQFSIYVRPDFYLELEARAAAQYQTVSRYVRQRLVHAQQSALPFSTQQLILAEVAKGFAATRELLLEIDPASALAARCESILGPFAEIRRAVRQLPKPPNAAKPKNK
jgi:hypothetical protein